MKEEQTEKLLSEQCIFRVIAAVKVSASERKGLKIY